MNPKLYLIIIAHATSLQLSQLKTFLKVNTIKQSPVSLRNAQNKSITCIGMYKDNILIVSDTLVLNCLQPELKESAVNLISRFGNKEMVVLRLDTAGMNYGYCIVRHGQVVRVKSGTPDGTLTNKGAPLLKESQIKAKLRSSLLESSILAKQYPDTVKRQHMADFEVGAMVVENLFFHYLNHDKPVDDLSNKILFRQYITNK